MPVFPGRPGWFCSLLTFGQPPSRLPRTDGCRLVVSHWLTSLPRRCYGRAHCVCCVAGRRAGRLPCATTRLIVFCSYIAGTAGVDGWVYLLNSLLHSPVWSAARLLVYGSYRRGATAGSGLLLARTSQHFVKTVCGVERSLFAVRVKLLLYPSLYTTLFHTVAEKERKTKKTTSITAFLYSLYVWLTTVARSLVAERLTLYVRPYAFKRRKRCAHAGI